jgi:hypothetical protein
MSRDAIVDALAGLTLEDHVMAPTLGALDASPLQRVITRASEGRPIGDLLTGDEMERYFGTRTWTLTVPPTIVCIVAGVRGGKTRLAANAAIKGAFTCDASRLPLHEVPRLALVGPYTDAADATFMQLRGIVMGSPIYRRFVEKETGNAILLRRPDGRVVEIVVVAAGKAGLSLRNRWLAGAIFEEAASFGEESQGYVVNVEQLEQAAITRLLPNAQVWFIGSPMGPSGRVYELWRKHFGKPGRVLVVHAPTRALNPSFPQETIDEVRAEQPDVAAREYDASWVDADSAFIPATLIDAATRPHPLIQPGHATSAGMDPGTRGNDWTFSVARRNSEGRVIILGVWRWQGSKQAPLSPRQTLHEIASIAREYSITQVHCDSWSFDALQDHARAAELTLVEHPNRDRDLPYQRLRTLLANGTIELPPDPLLRQDLLAIRQRATSGGVRIILPKTADGRHCDYAPAVALAASHAETDHQNVWDEIRSGAADELAYLRGA